MQEPREVLQMAIYVARELSNRTDLGILASLGRRGQLGSIR